MTHSEAGKPVAAIGTLLFFDYNKNNFGFIENANCVDGTTIEKLYVPKNGIATGKYIHDGELVTLLINKHTRQTRTPLSRGFDGTSGSVVFESKSLLKNPIQSLFLN